MHNCKLENRSKHWEVRKLRQVLRNVTSRNQTDLPLLSVVRERGVILRDISSKAENHNFIPDDLSNYKVVRSGQFVMNKMKAWQGSYGVSKFDGIVSPAYFIFDLQGVDGDFFHTAIRSRAYIPFFTQASDGVRIGQWDLNQTRMREIPFLVPPLDEQHAIVRYLDYMDRRISRYIRAKQKLIKLLEEQKQAIIHEAVTRGLDPNVRLKPSGVEWLGDVPEHWKVCKLEHIIDLITGYPFKSEGFTQDQRDIKLLRGVNIAIGQLRWVDTVYWPASESKAFAQFELLPGDLVLGMDRPIIKGGIRIAKFEASDVPALLLQRVARLRARSGLHQDYLLALLAGRCFHDYLSPIFTGISVPHLSPDQIKQFQLPLPPIHEQERIIISIKSEIVQIDAKIRRNIQGVDLLKEYRTRLFADIVTGKLDVRDAVKHLPLENDYDGSLIESDELIMDDEMEITELDGIEEEVDG